MNRRETFFTCWCFVCLLVLQNLLYSYAYSDTISILLIQKVLLFQFVCRTRGFIQRNLSCIKDRWVKCEQQNIFFHLSFITLISIYLQKEWMKVILTRKVYAASVGGGEKFSANDCKFKELIKLEIVKLCANYV